MKEINADLKVLANIKFAGKSYQLREISFGEIVGVKDKEDQTEATFDLIEQAGIPKEVSKKLSISVIKEIEQLLIGEINSAKK